MSLDDAPNYREIPEHIDVEFIPFTLSPFPIAMFTVRTILGTSKHICDGWEP